ncbi:MAG: hypothetical protein R2862_05815 [Thermoanaerobaculia bacterium]
MEAERRGISVRLWDFLFYATFACRHELCPHRGRLPGSYPSSRPSAAPCSPPAPPRLAIGWVVALSAGD